MNELHALSQGATMAQSLAARPTGDEALPALVALLQIDSAREWWDLHAAELTGLPARGLKATTPLRYRPGRRCTLRIDHSDGPSVFLKLMRAKRVRRVGKRLRALVKQGPWSNLVLPRPLARLDTQGALILEGIPGPSWEDVLVEGGGMAREAVAAVRRFQSLELEGLDVWTVADEIGVTTRASESLWSTGAEKRSRILTLLERVKSSLSACKDGATVLLHRDLHPQQVLSLRGSAGFVDLDGLAMGAPEIDMGNLLAHLDMFGLHLPDKADHMKAEGNALLKAWVGSTTECNPALAGARAAALLRLAGMHASRGTQGGLASGLVCSAEALVQEARP